MDHIATLAHVADIYRTSGKQCLIVSKDGWQVPGTVVDVEDEHLVLLAGYGTREIFRYDDIHELCPLKF